MIITSKNNTQVARFFCPPMLGIPSQHLQTFIRYSYYIKIKKV